MLLFFSVLLSCVSQPVGDSPKIEGGSPGADSGTDTAAAVEETSCRISPETLVAGTDAVAVLSGADHLSEIGYRWTVNDSAIDAGETLDGGWFSRGDTVGLAVEALDEGAVVSLDCGTVRVDNALPVGGVVALATPTYTIGRDLQCQLRIEPTDADGDVLSHRIEWTVDGEVYSGQDEMLPGDTVPAEDIQVGETWTCTLLTDDGITEARSEHALRILMLEAAPIQLVHVPAGSFSMGRSSDAVCSTDNQSQHTVTLTRGVWMGTTEVTQAQFEAVMGFNPAHFTDCPSCPVERESWFEAAEFTTRLSEMFGEPGCYDCVARTEEELDAFHDEHEVLDDEFAYRGCRYVCTDLLTPYDCGGFRLPTEAEWEYAARGGSRHGTTADFTDGGDLMADDCEECSGTLECTTTGTEMKSLMWYGCSSHSETHPVAGLQPNAVGLYDVHGNVYEWINDYWDLLDYTDEQVDPIGGDPSSGTAYAYKALRGGSYDTPAYQTALGTRWMDPMDSCYVYRLGFRIAMTGMSPSP